MLSKLLTGIRRQWIGSLALFLVLTGGVAYAAATIGSADVIDESLRSVDLKNGAAVKGLDVVDESLAGADVAESTLRFAQVSSVAGNVADTDPNGTGPDTPVLGAGPSVTVDVPSNGIVNILARATLAPNGVACVVALAEPPATDEDTIADQQLLYSDTGPPAAVVSRPGGASGVGESPFHAGWISFPASAGSHTYELVYWAAGGGGPETCTVSNRTLWASVTR